MEIKKTKNGWKYKGILFADEASAIAAKKSEESGESSSSLIGASDKFKEVYNFEKPTSFGQFVMEQISSGRFKSIIDFSERIEVSRQSLHKWMSGETIPTQAHVDRIKQITGINSKKAVEILLTNIQKNVSKVTGASEDEYGEVINGSDEASGGMAASGIERL